MSIHKILQARLDNILLRVAARRGLDPKEITLQYKFQSNVTFLHNGKVLEVICTEDLVEKYA